MGVGELDNTSGIRKSIAAWAEREPQAEYHVIAGAGHSTNLDRPDQTNALVLDFLERHLSLSRERRERRDSDPRPPA
jgi:pimeloyl-ACP methyl ester carboxylesterase